MGKIKRILVGMIALAAISGCDSGHSSFKVDSFSKEDMCVVQNDGHKKICYGDPRADIEQALGSAIGTMGNALEYGSGLTVYYRDGRAAGFALRDDSQGIYKTARGAQIGMTKSEMKDLYGQQYAYEATDANLDYAYDTVSGKFVEKEKVYSGEVQQRREEIYLVSAMFDLNNGGKASFIGLIDQKMAILVQ